VAAPVFQAQGAAVGNTTGDLTVGLPAHQADDILILVVSLWAPNTASAVDTIPTPSGWTQAGQTSFPATADGRFGVFWRRATSGSTTDPVISRSGLNWDTGADTNLSGRAYAIRGCKTSGNFWEDVNFSATHTAANGNFPAIDVLGSQRMVLLVALSGDDQGLGTPPSGWTAGGGDSTTEGTDSSFQTFRKDDHDTDTTAEASNANAPAQSRYWFFGWSIPPAEMSLSFSDTVTLSDSPSKKPGLGKTDTVTLSDSVAKKPGLGKADTVTLSDGISKEPGLGLTDAITLTDSVAKAVGVSLADVLTLTDSVGKSFAKALADTLTLSDSVAKAVGLVQGDSIALSDSISKKVGQGLNDVITLIDVLVNLVGAFTQGTLKGGGKARADTISGAPATKALGGKTDERTHGGQPARYNQGGKPKDTKHGGPVKHG
jgi:hypothetical protein